MAIHLIPSVHVLKRADGENSLLKAFKNKSINVFFPAFSLPLHQNTCGQYSKGLTSLKAHVMTLSLLRGRCVRAGSEVWRSGTQAGLRTPATLPRRLTQSLAGGGAS